MTDNQNLYAGNLPWSVTSEELANFMSSAGNVTSCEVQTYDGRSKGYGLVSFATAEDAQNAIITLNGMDFSGRAVEVRPDRGPKVRETRPPKQFASQPQGGGQTSGPTVYVGNLSWSATNEELTNLMSSAGMVVSCEIQVHQDSGRSKGWGLVTFSSTAEAQHAINELYGADLMGRNITLKEDRGKPSFSAGGGGRSRRGQRGDEAILYVNNLSTSAGWRDVKEAFVPYGATFADVKYNNDGTPFGTAHFVSVDAAQNALHECNGMDIHGLNVQLSL